MPTNPFVTTPISSVVRPQNDRPSQRDGRVNRTGEAPPSQTPTRTAPQSPLAAAFAYFDSPEEMQWMEEHLAMTRRRSRLHDDIGAPHEETSSQLERLLAKASAFDESALSALLSKFPGLEDSHNPWAMLNAANDPGLAALLMAGLLGASEERWRRLRKKLNEETLKKSLARYLKERGGEVAISLFSFLEFNEVQQLSTMKELYRYTADSCRTLSELFNHFVALPDRDKKLRALLRALAFELSQTPVESREHAGLIASIEHLSQLTGFLGLEATCAETATKLNGITSSRHAH